jgi:Fe-S-cluster-containing hydrogenase component 2
MTCAKRCPAEAIISAKNQIHVIDQEKCIKCGTCFEACPPKFGAVTKISGEPVPPPIPLESRTIVRKSKEKGVKS